MTPTSRIVRETVEATATAWHTFEHKDLLPSDILKSVSYQIDRAATGTLKELA